MARPPATARLPDLGRPLRIAVVGHRHLAREETTPVMDEALAARPIGSVSINSADPYDPVAMWAQQHGIAVLRAADPLVDVDACVVFDGALAIDAKALCRDRRIIMWIAREAPKPEDYPAVRRLSKQRRQEWARNPRKR